MALRFGTTLALCPTDACVPAFFLERLVDGDRVTKESAPKHTIFLHVTITYSPPTL